MGVNTITAHMFRLTHLTTKKLQFNINFRQLSFTSVFRKMYSVEERGAPNSFDYRVYISKLLLIYLINLVITYFNLI